MPYIFSIVFLLFIGGCSDSGLYSPAKETTTVKTASAVQTQTKKPTIATKGAFEKNIDYVRLRKEITYGKATAKEVLLALTEHDVGALTNTMHALYSMRWSRPVVYLLDDLWKLDKEKHPELAWDLIEKAPVRIALASTMNRILIFDTQEQKNYIRAHKNDKHEFHRAQVVIALALNGDPKDVPYIKDMADGENVFVAQSAITALGIINHKQAKEALISLYDKHPNDAKTDLILAILKKAYKFRPKITPAQD